MISKDLINTRLGLILSRLGKKVTNAALFREELGVDCPSDEAILSEDAKYLAEEEAKQQAIEASKQKEAAYSAWVAQGFNAGGYKLRVSDSDQIAFSKLMSSLMLKNPADSFEVKIEAMDGSIKTLTYAQFKTLMIAYGDYCYNSWRASKGIQ